LGDKAMMRSTDQGEVVFLFLLFYLYLKYYIMKKIFLSFIGLSFFFIAITLLSCKKDNSDPKSTSTLSNSQILASHSWTSVKTFNNNVDVTSCCSPLTYIFHSNNTYTASSSSGSSSGTWQTNGNVLSLDGNDWTIIELTSSSLKISRGTVTIYMN
jgi:hypothetical protein